MSNRYKSSGRKERTPEELKILTPNYQFPYWNAYAFCNSISRS